MWSVELILVNSSKNEYDFVRNFKNIRLIIIVGLIIFNRCRHYATVSTKWLKTTNIQCSPNI